ncbi:hypothetical protein ABMA27_015382 [Loxostege sticticalis]|uniref:Uncharacterized protein n=1 Tax=Loxostege sticticalis TaxID=481309 RepID=A0ABR3I7L7_LOXSC
MCIKDIVILSVVFLIVHNATAQITFDTENLANGEYYYAYSDGLYSKDETGKLGDEGILIVKGEYRYVLDDKEYVVTYTADKDGYHPKVTISDYTLPPPLGSGYAANLVASLVG